MAIPDNITVIFIQVLFIVSFTTLQEKYPKSQIDVFITVVEDGGSLLATCITAAGLALCHASIDVYDLVVGSSVVSKSYFKI